MTDHRRTRTPGYAAAETRQVQRRRWDPAGIRALGVTTDVVTAGEILGLSRNTAYRLVRAGEFPVPVIKAGGQYRIPVAGLLTVLGLEPLAEVPDGSDNPHPLEP
jgi:excisionase family DNA binding protein